MALTIFRKLHSWFRPALVALFYPNIAWGIRWRLLILQQISILTYSIGSVPYLFRRPFTEEWLPITPNRVLRAIVFKANGTGRGRMLRPLHVDIHGGAFIGGLPESNAPFDERVANETGAVVVSLTYRYAPEHPFPAPVDDIDEAIRFIQHHAAERWGADPALMTVSGFSAGGCLAVASMQQPNCHGSAPHSYKAALTFCGVLDCRINPGDKPRPAGMPEKDPAAVLFPLFDSYGAQARVNGHMDDPRLSPVLAPRETLPERMLLCVAGIDILLAEQMEFANRINEEDKKDGDWERPRVEVFLEEKGFHGYHEGE